MSDIFLGNDGNELIAGKTDYLSRFFDWVVNYQDDLRGHKNRPDDLLLLIKRKN